MSPEEQILHMIIGAVIGAIVTLTIITITWRIIDEAQVRKLKYKNTQPKVAGWYWKRKQGKCGSAYSCVYINKHGDEDQDAVEFTNSPTTDVITEGWSGPILRPR